MQIELSKAPTLPGSLSLSNITMRLLRNLSSFSRGRDSKRLETKPKLKMMKQMFMRDLRPEAVSFSQSYQDFKSPLEVQLHNSVTE